jgi:hypothetical protein
MTEHEITILQIPLYALYYLDNIEDARATREGLEHFRGQYDEATFDKIVNGLEWACNNPTYPFVSLLPNTRFSNEEAYGYLVKLRQAIQEHLNR